MPPPSKLALDPSVRAAILRQTRAAYPLEGCGLLLGTRQADRAHVLVARHANNLAASPDRYELDPADIIAADSEARAKGRQVLGVWHSHPDRPAGPSAADRAEGVDGWIYVIAALPAVGPAELRAWYVQGEAWHTLTVESGPPPRPSPLAE